MQINKFQFLITLTAIQFLANPGFTHERPDRFAQDLGGNSVCSPANRRDRNSRCPLRETSVVVAPRTNTSAPTNTENSEIPAPQTERVPSAITE